MNDKSNKSYNWHEYSIELERSLLEQDSYIAYLKAKVAELEKFQKEFTPLAAYLARECNTTDGDLLYRFKHWLAKRDLEQQAKALEELLTYPNHRFHGDSRVYYSEYSINRAIENLRKQAKGGDE